MSYQSHSLAALAATACLGLAMTSALAADVKTGQEIFMHAGCWQCHGTTGHGGSAGPTIGPNPLPIAAFTAFLRSPPGLRMPPYREPVLSDEEIADIHTYLESVTAPVDISDTILAQ